MPNRKTTTASRSTRLTRSKTSTLFETFAGTSSIDVTTTVSKKKYDKSSFASTPVKSYEQISKPQRIDDFKANLIIEMEADRDAYEKSIAMLKLRHFTSDYLNRPLSSFTQFREMFSMDVIEESGPCKENTNPKSKNTGNISSDGFKAPKTMPKPASKKTSKRASSRKKDSGMKTPTNNYPYIAQTPITPKLNMNEPLSVLRQPRLGEQAVSMSGSPLLVSSVPNENVASVNVPLSGGKVMTILPRNGFCRELLPHLDSERKEELQTLYRHLGLLFAKRDCEDDEYDDDDDDDDEEEDDE